MPSDPRLPFWHPTLQDEVGWTAGQNHNPSGAGLRETLHPGSTPALRKKRGVSSGFFLKCY